LVASVAGMMYLGWIAWGYRTQYRMLLERVVDAGRLSRADLDSPEPTEG
jgi:hypothetical protein